MNWPIISLGWLIAQLQEAETAAERVYEVLDTVPTVLDWPGVRPLEIGTRAISAQSAKGEVGSGDRYHVDLRARESAARWIGRELAKRDAHLSVGRKSADAGKWRGPYPVALKVQVASGGRGKAGGVLRADDKAQAESNARALFEREFGGERPASILRHVDQPGELTRPAGNSQAHGTRSSPVPGRHRKPREPTFTEWV